MLTRMALGFVFSLLVILQASQDYPSKPVRIIEPFGAGGGPDLIGRAISPKLSELWGQPVTVENHPGAESTAAPALVSESPPDGYTLLFAVENTMAVAKLVQPTVVQYDSQKDFAPISLIGSQPNILVVNPKFPATTMAELIPARPLTMPA